MIRKILKSARKLLEPRGRLDASVPCSPHLQFMDSRDVFAFIQSYRESATSPLSFLDVGGRRGEFRRYAEGFDYKILELDDSCSGEEVIIGDICKPTPIEEDTFDVCFSNHVFEHLLEPWAAAEECVRITKPGGLLIHITLFAWRYHPVPGDYFRFTHSGLASLFERTGRCRTEFAGYNLRHRRENRVGGKLPDGLDRPPIDEWGGWRENWETIFVGFTLDGANSECSGRVRTP